MSRQTTISKAVAVEGKGLFSGQPCRLEFLPAQANEGITFVRTDLEPAVPIPVCIENLTDCDRRTSLAVGDASVETVEHVLSAVAGLGIDNVTIHMNSPEPPNTDGSPKPFAEALTDAGKEELDASRAPWVITEPITVSNGSATLTALPGAQDCLDIVYDLDYSDTPAIGRQLARFTVGQDDYNKELAWSRTFLLQAEAEAIRQQGIGQHLTQKDVLVFGPEGPIDNPLHADDEPVRHKICDLVGDLTLLGKPLAGRILASKSGHGLNHQLVKAIIEKAQAASKKTKAPVMDIHKVLDLLPHRYPFLMIDRVLEIEDNKRAVAIKNVTINEPFFQGHYPNEPIMPGVMIVEALAQLSGILLGRNLEQSGKVAVLLSIDNVKLRRAVRPGDQLTLQAEAIRVRARMGHCQCQALVDGELATEAEIKFMLADASKV